jgi:uncharacterized protein YecE (DUF72 family)
MILTGSCSWTEKSLIGSGEFYPKDIKSAEERLRYYADQFSTVEVDSSYYAIPDKGNAALWAERTPDYFIFHVKAFGALTGHGIDPKALPKDIASVLPASERDKRNVYIKSQGILQIVGERFVESLSPLREKNKLGMIVFQYPPWFTYKTGTLDYLLTCKELMDGLDLAVEFRHGSWLTAQRAGAVLDFLRKNGITYIAADEPQYGTLATIPFFPAVTTDTAYFRFHGRNRGNWLKRGLETSLRYDYFYSDDELKEFAEPVIEAAQKATRVYAMFNNCHGAFAIRNARRMEEMLKQRGERVA